MPTATDGGAITVGMEALNRLKTTAPPLYLTPSPELSKDARLASQYLFTPLNSYAPKSPFTHLLTEGFDAEQIWQQIDLQSVPLLSSLRRHVRNFEKNPQEIEKLFSFEKRSGKKEDNVIENGEGEESQGAESESEDFDDEDEEEEEEDGDDDEGEMENMERESVNGVEDRFLKISELEEYLEEDEAREYGLKKKDSKRKRSKINDEDEDEDGDGDGEEEEEEEEEQEEEELGFMGLGDADEDDDEDGNKMENARYEDFFGGKRTGQKKKSVQIGGSLDIDVDYELNNGNKNQKKQGLSTHEKEQENLRSEIEKLERVNLEPKTWTMQGEVTAAKRPKNSALEVDLDFEHNVRPAPVITEEVTASLEELIQKRVLEDRFDDVRKPPTLVQKAPREKIELDENKSKKGLAELYEDEYAQKTGLVSTALSFSDEQKKEASMLFKKLCLKLDALSHFHFTPKPVIEDMSIRENVPALAMEEIAPLAVSDAALLAPEEVFSGKGHIKEETELTKTERKRRRANKKRRFKARAAKQMATKMQQSTLVNHENGSEDK